MNGFGILGFLEERSDFSQYSSSLPNESVLLVFVLRCFLEQHLLKLVCY